MTFRRAGIPLLPVLLALLLPASPASAQAGRFFKPAEGFTQAKDLPEDFSAVVRSAQLAIKDAFDGSTANSEVEAEMFAIGNRFHIESRAGTIRRRLLFREGDTVTKSDLMEAEKALRSEEFLADAIIEAKQWEDGTAHLIVTTYDQWTTTVGFTPQFLGGRFFYQLGVVESNLLGTGQRLGFFLGHGRERDMRWIDYNNNALTPLRLRLASHLAWLSDGYSTLFSLSKPLESRADRYAFSASWSAEQLSEFVYFDANRLDRLPDAQADSLAGRSRLVYQFDKVATHEVNLSATRSFGRRTKFNVSPTADWKDRYNHGVVFTYGINRLVPPHPTASRPEERFDLLGGLSWSLYQYRIKTVSNYRNLKWSESLETGWRLTSKAARNQEWLGARNDDFYLSHGAAFNNAWWNAVFLNSAASLRYFVSPGGDFDNGHAGLSGEVQLKPHPATSTTVSGSYGGLFAAERSQQLVLGDDSGLSGYPNAYYAGQALLLLEAEQRYFPSFEFGTLVPALAVFWNAGNTYPVWDDFDPADLHHAIGAGLRLGLSKTVQKLVWHVNFSKPVGEERLDGFVFSFRVKTSL